MGNPTDEKRTINSFVSRKVRELRVNKKIKMQELATRAGIPLGSYACMENGYYNINLDNLFRILGVLEADISEVWPVENIGADVLRHSGYIRRIQEFRVNEIISLSGAEGAVLMSVRKGKCEVQLHQNLSDFLLDRLVLYTESGRRYEGGCWFERRNGDCSYHFFLKVSSCPPYLSRLVEQYLIIWSHLFAR
ncbi:MAG TPA: helix-turn-helix transcriptional regulator [Acidobacteriota bacterium]|jgi:transcriptional regulator with XRE-family HTH domain